MNRPVSSVRKAGFALRGVCTAALAVAIAIPAPCLAADPPPQPPAGPEDIVVTAPPFLREIAPERNFDALDIDAYGVSTIGDFLAELQRELGDGDELPLIFVNGDRVGSIDDIAGLPVEALRNVSVLPRGSATKAGGKVGQRVISLNLKPSFRSLTLDTARNIATDGDWHSDRGEALLTQIKGDTRFNLSLRGRRDTALYESDRNIIQRPTSSPFSLDGNIVGYPSSESEIDPALSDLAGFPVVVVPLPHGTVPTLAQLVPLANHSTTTDLGQFRTLRPESRNFDVNGSASTRLAPWLRGSATLRFSRTTSDSERGLASVLFRLSPDNPFSPFSRTVGIAQNGDRALKSRSVNLTKEGNVTFDANVGQWTGNLLLRHRVLDFRSRSERSQLAGTVLLDDDVDPFSADLPALLLLRSDTARSRQRNSSARLLADGPLATLPAGPVHATAEANVEFNRLSTSSTYATGAIDRQFKRNQQSVRGALDVPVASRESGTLSAIGNLSFDAEFELDHFSDAGSFTRHALGSVWEPLKWLRLHGEIESRKEPAVIQTIGDPVVITPDILIFDPLTGQTVAVQQVTGGNPDLKPETTRIRRLGGLVRIKPSINLQLTADYTDSDRRDFVSSLPESSAAVMLAFPDRFVRSSEGRLVSVDLRPVNFDSDREQRVRWGISLSKKFGSASTPASKKGAATKPAPRRTTTLQFSANHTIVLSEEIVIRPGLDRVDILKGGAVGIGGGRLRHQADATFSLERGGLGMRLKADFRGPSKLVTRINGKTGTLEFSSLFKVDAKLFADAEKVFGAGRWAKGLRLTLSAANITNDRQSVRDSMGVTPLQYQRGFRDPIGRTIEFEVRKIF